MERRNKGSEGRSEAGDSRQTSLSRRGDNYSNFSDGASSNSSCLYRTPLPDGFGVNRKTRKYRYKKGRDDQPYKINRKLHYNKPESGNSYSECNSHEPIHKTGNLCSESSSQDPIHKTVNSCSESSSQVTSYAFSSNIVSISNSSIMNGTDVDVDEPDSVYIVKPSCKRLKSQYSENNYRCKESLQCQPLFFNTYPPLRKKSNIFEDSGDLEIDTIIPQDVCDKFLLNPPNNLPMDYTDMNPSEQPLPRQHSILEVFGLRPNKVILNVSFS